MLKPNSVIKVNTQLDTFFANWLLFLRPFHQMTDRQIDFASKLLKHRHRLSKVILNEAALNEQVFGPTVRQLVVEECGITMAFYRVLLRDLTKHQFIIDGAINPRFIPKVVEGAKSFSLMLFFEFKDDDTSQRSV